ncbi:uncharacterized protein LAESUDRAFT_459549 [Laetiporus sulphureus 93-53]|uniref:Uncharacterized protein n=1 Tax=Laetiporus sulphureus 93-53 TaxID=1314785 RepID=A0A165BRH0_9APHY|nr:uncharacterized protein LAESUDRAFT_459549 [Laetiporus sulphureus 93-53]KZT01519.1 hypothetical protein LAESUDRAFT_459549 [Laetiporus sulphureus 93-53]
MYHTSLHQLINAHSVVSWPPRYQQPPPERKYFCSTEGHAVQNPTALTEDELPVGQVRE